MASSSLSKPAAEWESIDLKRDQLDLRKTLLSGQSFRWRKIESESDDQWAGPLSKYVVVLRRVDNRLDFKFIDAENRINFNTTLFTTKERQAILADYFHLNLDLSELCKQWANGNHSLNQQFKSVYQGFEGLRLLRQTPLECLFSFICSQNNNISRITKMVESLSSFGDVIATHQTIKFHSFPTLEQLSKISEDQLKKLGFGYRAAFIVKATAQVKDKGGVKWLESLREQSQETTHTELTSLMGVGQKVADCVSLFSMDKLDIVPIDTHIFKISKQHIPSLAKKTLTPKIYKDIRSFWKEKFGPYAGWGHTILFANEIAVFKKQPDSASSTTQPKKGEKREIEDETDEISEVKEDPAPSPALPKRNRRKPKL